MTGVDDHDVMGSRFVMSFEVICNRSQPTFSRNSTYEARTTFARCNPGSITNTINTI